MRKILFCLLWLGHAAFAFEQAPMLQAQVDNGTLPPIEERLPVNPLVVSYGKDQTAGQYGGTLRMQMTAAKEVRQMVVYGYARLVKYDRNYNVQPDILQSVEVEQGRIFTLTLREGHKWSDGADLTAEDFRFWWQDVANNVELYPAGPPSQLRVANELPTVEVLNPLQIRYSWRQPNPNFLSQLAKASPLYIYAPRHYLQQFHADYQDEEILNNLIEQYGKRNWGQLFNSLRKSYANTNPNLPSLQPWVLQTQAPAQTFSFTRNPYFHRVDEAGRQLPYIDEWKFNITQKKLISLKAATGESTLQARHLRFADISLLVGNEEKYGFKTYFWKQGRGAHMALYPNLNAVDDAWRAVLRNKKFRQALSLGINRREINRVIYFATAEAAQNSVLSDSPLFQPHYRDSFTEFDISEANRLLDSIGLAELDGRGIRKLPDGRPLDIIVETASGGSEQADVLSLIADSWRQIGVKLHIKPTSLEVARRRIFSGFTKIYIAGGVDNGIASVTTTPEEFVPVRQVQYQWPKWGQYYQTDGKSGEAPDTPEGVRLMQLYENWISATNDYTRRNIWAEILQIHSENLFTIGILSGTIQPVTVSDKLKNVPSEAIWAWDPGAHFGLYNTDLFWLEE